MLGALEGDILPSIVSSALGIAIYGMFIAIVVPPAKKEPSTAACVFLAIVLSCIFYYVPILKNNIPSGFTIIICSVIASAFMAFLAPLPAEEGNDE